MKCEERSLKAGSPSGRDARGHNIASDARQAYCGEPGVPPAFDTEKTKVAFPAGDSLESKLLCLQSFLRIFALLEREFPTRGNRRV